MQKKTQSATVAFHFWKATVHSSSLFYPLKKYFCPHYLSFFFFPVVSFKPISFSLFISFSPLLSRNSIANISPLFCSPETHFVLLSRNPHLEFFVWFVGNGLRSPWVCSSISAWVWWFAPISAVVEPWVWLWGCRSWGVCGVGDLPVAILGCGLPILRCLWRGWLTGGSLGWWFAPISVDWGGGKKWGERKKKLK